MKRLELKVSGMTCTGCEQQIAKALSRLEGVVR
ncbi:MAG: cation transporter, partial [Actinomycetota bacterium]